MEQQGNYRVHSADNDVIIMWKGKKAFDVLTFLFAAGSRCLSPQNNPDFILESAKNQILVLFQENRLIYKGAPGKTAVRLLDLVIHELAV